ncbi:MAG TPA: YHYH domain-containing protein [Rhodocyclaceae bacterium]|nr:YHYH domain-containing protein [Rhodocyclaceae bacterium]
MLRKPILVALTVLSSPMAFGHGGGLDADGCHTNRKTGEYHCHRSSAAKPKPSQPTEKPNAKSAQVSAQPLRSLPPGCYVGPRGGTYTITKSGRKNYRGC